MPLPAPYAPPWKRLGEDGVALLAWLGLKLRELWRRNGEGSLPVPRFWPRRWPRLFWPLVVAAVLLAALGVGKAWMARSVGGDRQAQPMAREGASGRDAGRALLSSTRDSSRSPDRSIADDGTTAADRSTAADRAPTGPLDAAAEGSADRSKTGANQTRLENTGVERRGEIGEKAEPSSPPEADNRQSTDAASSFTEAPVEAPTPSPTAAPADAPGVASTDEPRAAPDESPAEREANRLRAQWTTDDRDTLIADLRADPAAATLTLDLDDAFLALKADQRQRQAERWQQKAAEEGYSHLRLQSGRGRLVGRDALVGGGMILLDPFGAGSEAP